MLCHQDSSFNFFVQESTNISYLYFLKLGGVRIYDILVELDIVFSWQAWEHFDHSACENLRNLPTLR